MPDEEARSARQQGAEADIEGFKEQLGPFVVAAETTRMPMVFTDAKAPGSPITFANQSFLTLVLQPGLRVTPVWRDVAW